MRESTLRESGAASAANEALRGKRGGLSTFGDAEAAMPHVVLSRLRARGLPTMDWQIDGGAADPYLRFLRCVPYADPYLRFLRSSGVTQAFQ